MGLKILFIIIVLLISFSVQSQNKASGPDFEKSVSAAISLKRADIIRFAKNLLGTPYLFASCDIFTYPKICLPPQAYIQSGIKPETCSLEG
jgi:hypothetical protein